MSISIKEIMKDTWKAHKEHISVYQDETKLAFIHSSPNEIMDFAVIAQKMPDGSISCSVGEYNKGEVILTRDTSPLFYHNNQDDTIRELCKMLDGSISRQLVERYVHTLPERIRSKAPVDKLVASEKKAIEDRIMNFLNVDQEALNLIRFSDFPTIRAYKYYSDRKDETIHTYRTQAAQTYPIMANLIAERITTRHAVDNSNPLLAVLIEAMGKNSLGENIISKGLMKRFVNKQFAPNAVPLERLLFDLSELPPDWFPKDQENWNAFCDITATIGQTFRNPEIKMETLYKSCAGDWVGFKERLALAFADTRPPDGATKNDMDYLEKAIDFKSISKLPKAQIQEMAEMISQKMPLPDNVSAHALEDYIVKKYAPDSSRDALDEACENFKILVKTFQDTILMPTAAYASQLNNPRLNFGAQTSLAILAKSMLTEGKSAIAILESTRKGTNLIMELSRKSAPAVKEKKIESDCCVSPEDIEILKRTHAWDGNVEFPYVYPPIQAPNGVYIVPLLSINQISREGECMRHCVGDNYVGRCIQGTSNIFSFRSVSESGEVMHLSTMDISPNNSSMKISCNLGYQNTKNIPANAKQAENWFRHNHLHMMSPGKIQTSSALEETGVIIQKTCGFDWKSADNIQERMRPWGSMISKTYRIPLDKFLDIQTMQDVAHLLNPALKVKKSPEMSPI